MKNVKTSKTNKKKKRDPNKVKKRYIVILLLVLLLMGVTVGYSVLSTSLTISGVTKIKTTKVWDVHFESVNVTEGSVKENVKPHINKGKTSITYSVDLAKPGDFYEFTITVRNSGSIDAKLSDAPMISGIDENDAYVKHTFTHNDNSPIVIGEGISVGSAKKYKVRIEYIESVPVEESKTYSITINIPFEQI